MRLFERHRGIAFFVCLFCSMLDSLAFGQIKPIVKDITLEVAGKTIRAIDYRSDTGSVIPLGDLRIEIKGNVVSELTDHGAEPSWSVKSTDELQLRWLGNNANTAFFAGYAFGTDGKLIRDPMHHIRRLDLDAHVWKTPIVLPGALQFPVWDNIVGILADERRLILISQSCDRDPGDRNAKPVNNCLTLFELPEGKLAWTKTFPAYEARPEPGVHLLSDRMPDFSYSSLQPLSWLGDRILVSFGEKDPLLCIDLDGKTIWQRNKIWELQRGFTGPSVWSHHIGRFGTARWDEQVPTEPSTNKQPDLNEQFTDQSRAFNQNFECAIVGGPLVVKGTKRRDARIYVAVAKGPNAWNWGYLSDCLIYEFAQDGSAVGITTIPRLVHGDRFAILNDGVVWLCQNNAIIRLKSTESTISAGPGGPDAIIATEWYRQLQPHADVEAWLSTTRNNGVMAINETTALFAMDGAYVQKAGDRELRYRINIVDLATSAVREAILIVPTSEPVPAPAENFFGSGNRIYARGPYLIGITKMQLEGKRLHVTLGMEKRQEDAWFDFPTLDAAPPSTTPARN